MKSKEILSALEKEARQNKESGSYLFYGDKRVDLLFYALEFSKMVMTKDIKEEAEKEKIYKRIKNFQHPDIEIINRKNENIKIDEIRKIIYESIESPYSSPKKIFILSGIENIRKESSNALLKILEEPPKNVYFILLSRSLDIIPTLKSRTLKFHLESLDNNELGVSKEIYYFFDGNENDIKNYKKSGILIEEYENFIDSPEKVIESIREMKDFEKMEKEEKEDTDPENGIKDEIEIIIKYNKSVEYISRKIRFLALEEIYKLISEIEGEFKNERKSLISFLGKVIVASRLSVNGEELKKLINLKNSIRNNVNVRSVLFNFFDILSKS